METWYRLAEAGVYRWACGDMDLPEMLEGKESCVAVPSLSWEGPCVFSSGHKGSWPDPCSWSETLLFHVGLMSDTACRKPRRAGILQKASRWGLEHEVHPFMSQRFYRWHLARLRLVSILWKLTWILSLYVFFPCDAGCKLFLATIFCRLNF